MLALSFGPAAAAEKAEPPGASLFANPNAANAVGQACVSPLPFVVLDAFAFSQPVNVSEDIRAVGGDKPPLEHGDIVAAIVDASHPGAIPYQLSPAFSPATLADDLRRLADDIERGVVSKPAAIISSIVLPMDLDALNRAVTGGTVTETDLVDRRIDVLRIVTDDFNPRNPYTGIDRQLRRFSRAQIPIFVAAGNTAPEPVFNVLALSDGVYAVGSLDRDGSKVGYTNAPKFVSVWSPGSVVVTETPDGLSVSRGKATELKGAALPGQKALIAEFSARKAEEVVQPFPEEAAELAKLVGLPHRRKILRARVREGIYRTDEVLRAYGVDATAGSYRRAIAEGPYMHFPSGTIFKSGSDGVLSFDPLDDGTPGQLQLQDATSFAAPNICAAKLSP